MTSWNWAPHNWRKGDIVQSPTKRAFQANLQESPLICWKNMAVTLLIQKQLLWKARGCENGEEQEGLSTASNWCCMNSSYVPWNVRFDPLLSARWEGLGMNSSVQHLCFPTLTDLKTEPVEVYWFWGKVCLKISLFWRLHSLRNFNFSTWMCRTDYP